MRAARLPGIRSSVVLAVLAATVALLPGQAGAVEHERVTIAEGETIVRQYPQIYGNDPDGEEFIAPNPPMFTDPESCRGAPDDVCDIIPITIAPPATAGAELLVRFTLDWSAEPDPSGLTSLQTTELAMYLWHDPQKERSATSIQDEDAEPDEDGEQEGEDFNPGAGFRKPQRINFFTTEPGDYLLVVRNRRGWNEGGYSLELVYFDADIVPPTELGDPVRRPIDRSGEPAGGDAAPARPPSGPSEPPPALDVDPAPGPVLEPLELDADDEFGVVSEEFDTALAAPGPVTPFPTRARAVAATPPSTASLLIWLVAFPMLLIAAAGAFLRRRNPATAVI